MLLHALSEPAHLAIFALGLTIGFAVGFGIGLVVWLVAEFILVPPLARWIANHEDLDDARRW